MASDTNIWIDHYQSIKQWCYDKRSNVPSALELPGVLKSPGMLDTTGVLTPTGRIGIDVLEVVLENIGVLLGEIPRLEPMPEAGAPFEGETVLKVVGMPGVRAMLEL